MPLPVGKCHFRSKNVISCRKMSFSVKKCHFRFKMLFPVENCHFRSKNVISGRKMSFPVEKMSFLVGKSHFLSENVISGWEIVFRSKKIHFSCENSNFGRIMLFPVGKRTNNLKNTLYIIIFLLFIQFLQNSIIIYRNSVNNQRSSDNKKLSIPIATVDFSGQETKHRLPRATILGVKKCGSRVLQKYMQAHPYLKSPSFKGWITFKTLN